MEIAPLSPADVDAVVARIARRLRDDARRNDLVAPALDRAVAADALRAAAPELWVARRRGRVVGHLYGAVLGEGVDRAAWVGPDGSSFDDVDTLASLYAVAGRAWLDAGASRHVVWALDDAVRRAPWLELGFARTGVRASYRLAERRVRPLPAGYRWRPGGVDQLDVAVALAREIDHAQALGPSFVLDADEASLRNTLIETLDDPETIHHLVEYNGQIVAQAITFPLEPRRGSFDASWHLSTVAVASDHRGRGVATALVDHALFDAHARGGRVMETSWRATNRGAQRFWLGYGFRPTYLRLQRRVGVD
ncbi:MAG: GNAT family N-acetyltransferase [Acidimicrobiales bacterium]